MEPHPATVVPAEPTGVVPTEREPTGSPVDRPSVVEPRSVTAAARLHRTSGPGVDDLPRPDWLSRQVWPFGLRALDLGGHRVAHTDVGAGPALLFAHAGMWSFLWRDVILRLAGRYRCITFDPLGSGLSDRVPPERVDLATVQDTIGTLLDRLDLQDVTLVVHDLGGAPALAAARQRADRVAAVAAVNTFGWRPSGLAFRTMLAVFGSGWMREFDARTGWLPAAAATRFGVGRHLDGPARRAFRAGMDRSGRATMHRLFGSARRSPRVFEEAEAALAGPLQDRPMLTVFGALGDHLGFRRQWRRRVRNLEEVTIPWGLHFPMGDDPVATARALDDWHRRRVAR